MEQVRERPAAEAEYVILKGKRKVATVHILHGTGGGVQMFHISERITADLVNWYATARGRYFAFADRSSRPAAEIADMIGALL